MADAAIRTVIKRTGDVVPYDSKKIYAAISGANKDAENEMTENEIMNMLLQVDIELQENENIGVEEIQDVVEDNLMKGGFTKTAREYIKYRQIHEIRRNSAQHLMESYNELLFADAKDMDLKRDNANIDGNAPMGIMLKLGTEGAKVFYDNYATPKEFIEADQEGIIHIHDKDFSLITFNCLQMNLAKTLENGFSTGHGFLREPNSIRAAASLACISLQSSQNDCYGGQSLSNWDGALAKYVKKSFIKTFKKELINALKYSFKERKKELLLSEEMISDKESGIKNYFPSYLNMELEKKNRLFSYLYDYFKDEREKEDGQKIMFAIEQAYENTCEIVEDETMQAMEGAVHNFNTLHSRAGAQVPFSSILFGMDTTPEGRLVTRMTLQSIWNGLGHGETAIFPIAIMQLRSGVNYNPGDPNYDLFQFACKVSAKRLFPNFLSLNASFNLPYYRKGDPDSFVCAMGCRTKTMSNLNGPSESSGRGNFAFTTINLPYLALMANKDVDRFFELLDHYIGLSKRYLEYRFEIIAKKKVKNFPFVMGQGLYMGSENLGPEDEIRPALLNSTLSIGFCGLAECLVALIGKHHGESDEAQELGLKIISHMRDMTEMYKRQTHMNWSTFSTPAEATAGAFLRACRKKFGIIDGVTNHEFFSNSFHVPVYYQTTIKHKVNIEAPYHFYCDAGAISYVELDGDPSNNVEAFEKVVRYMVDSDMGYVSINHPVDRDPVCGYTGIIKNECPHCHRREDGHYKVKIKRMR